MKKLIVVLIGLLIFGLVVVLLVSSNNLENNQEQVGLPNPASVYCLEKGGESEIRKMVDGSERGFCLFADGSECDEWSFFREECESGVVFCKDLCGDGICQEVVCEAIGCPCAETPESCPQDCV